MFYSKSTQGFYAEAIHGSRLIERVTIDQATGEPLARWTEPNPDSKIPADAVEITSEQHASLLTGQSQGKLIHIDITGYPVLVDPPAQTLADLKTALMADVDAQISDIYGRFTRFETEYVQREAAARAFKAGGYAGDAGVWVMSFATNAGMTANLAADLIISQADNMRAALQALGALRMGKYGIAAAASEAAAQAVHDDIVAQSNAIAASL